MRCVVTSLTEDGPSDLAEELARGEALQVYDHSPHEVDAENWQTWTPDPVDADPCKSKSGVLARILLVPLFRFCPFAKFPIFAAR